MTFSLHDFVDEDWPALSRLWAESWRAARPEIDFIARLPWLKNLFAQRRAEGATILVAAAEAGLLGFVLFDAQTKWLDQIAVVPEAQGLGVATALIEAAKQACGDRLGLDVNADNFRALKFYQRENFIIIAAGRNPLSGLSTLVLEWRRPQLAAATSN